MDHVRQNRTVLYDCSVTLSLKKCEFLTNGIDYLGRYIRRGCLEKFTLTVDTICLLRCPTTLNELRSFLGLFDVFRHIVTSFARVHRSSSKELRKVQLQRFQKLTYDETTTSETLNTKSVDPPYLHCHVRKATTLLDRDSCNQTIWWFLCRRNPSVPKTRLGIGLGCLTTPSQHTIPHTDNVLLWCGQYCYSDLIWNPFRSPSALTTTRWSGSST